MKFPNVAANAVGWLGLTKEVIVNGGCNGDAVGFQALFCVARGTCAAL